MMKYTLKYIAIFLFLFTSLANAGLITSELTEDNYITFGGYDWTWASTVNVASYGENTLYDPDEDILTRVGWRHLFPEELNILKNDISIDKFYKKDEFGDEFLVQSIEYWNTHLITVTDLDINNFNDNKINSELTVGLYELTRWHYETFYVRESVQVSEPRALFIFALALILLAMRKKIFSK